MGVPDKETVPQRENAQKSHVISSRLETGRPTVDVTSSFCAGGGVSWSLAAGCWLRRRLVVGCWLARWCAVCCAICFGSESISEVGGAVVGVI